MFEMKRLKMYKRLPFNTQNFIITIQKATKNTTINYNSQKPLRKHQPINIFQKQLRMTSAHLQLPKFLHQTISHQRDVGPLLLISRLSGVDYAVNI